MPHGAELGGIPGTAVMVTGGNGGQVEPPDVPLVGCPLEELEAPAVEFVSEGKGGNTVTVMGPGGLEVWVLEVFASGHGNKLVELAGRVVKVG